MEDAADLAAADGDALGLGGCGQGVQRPLARLLLISRSQGAIRLADKPPGWVAASQGDDPSPLQLPKPPGPTRAGQVPEVINAAGVEAVQPAIDGAGMAAELGGDLAHWAPSQLRVMMRARCSQLAGAWRAPATRRMRRSSVGSAGGRANSGGNMAPLLRHKVRNTSREPSSYTTLKERSTSSRS